jgi:hypothetical protein
MILYKEIFENWTRVVNKNQNTKLSKQTSKPQETQPGQRLKPISVESGSALTPEMLLCFLILYH